jgi:hypothetical protein
MLYSGMLRHVALVRTDVSEECITSIIRVKRTSDLGTTLTITSNMLVLMLMGPVHKPSVNLLI